MEKAFEWLRKRGAAKASDFEKSGRATNAGLVAVAVNDFEAAMIQVTNALESVLKSH